MAVDNEADLRRAIQGGDEIVPYFQPLVELRSGKLTGFEVLARWQHPVHGLVPPNDFIPLAESTGLIGPLIQKMLRGVFKAATSFPEHLTLSVNISPTQLHDPSLPDQLARAAQRGNFPFHRLIFEITESALLHNIEHAQAVTRHLKSLGARLALDDFGTGYSSLRHLQALPFDEIKVDADFVRSMTEKRESRKIVAAVVGLGNSLGLVTVAEGVETKAQADMLLWQGCDFGQGHLYGLPVPASQLAPLLAEAAKPETARHNAATADRYVPPRIELLPNEQIAQLQAIYDSAPVGLCFLDPQLRFVNINQRLAEINHLSVSDHLGRHISEVLPQLFTIVGSNLQRALAGESLVGIEVHLPPPAPGEREITHLVSYQPARDEAGEVIGIAVSVVDITDRKHAEEAIRSRQEGYRKTLELNTQIPWTSDADGSNLHIAPRWKELTGLTSEESSSEGWLKAVHPDDIVRTRQAWRESLLTGAPYNVEYRVSQGNNEWRWIRARGIPCLGPSGEILRWYGSVEDIHDHRSSHDPSEMLLSDESPTRPIARA